MLSLKAINPRRNDRDRKISDSLVRNEISGYTRRDHYIEPTIGDACMSPLVRAIMTHDKESPLMDKASTIASKEYTFQKDNGGNINNLIRPLFAIDAESNYWIIFYNAIGLSLCGYRMSYNDTEKDIVEQYRQNASKENMEAFGLLMAGLVRERQLTEILHGTENIDGIMYENFPNETAIFSEPYVKYLFDPITNETLRKYNSHDIFLSAIQRGVPVEKINDIFPEDIDARFFARDFTEYEKSQFESL